MTTLLIADHDNALLKDATAKAMTAASALGADVHILVAGKDCRTAAEEAAKLAGVAKVLHVDADDLALSLHLSVQQEAVFPGELAVQHRRDLGGDFVRHDVGEKTQPATVWPAAMKSARMPTWLSWSAVTAPC